jgi:hypothetical protein
VAGYTNKHIDWACVKWKPNMLMEEHIPMAGNGEGPVNIGPTNIPCKVDLDVWITFFLKHQRKKMPWKHGLVFRLMATVDTAEVFGGRSANCL